VGLDELTPNTNMPTAVIGERIARSLLGSARFLADGGVAPPTPFGRG
jgi:hypothetical protein